VLFPAFRPYRQAQPQDRKMTIALLFWILMLFWLCFGAWQNGALGWPLGGHLLLWVVIALLGWNVFGPMIHG
jgi:hypothetical protein